MYPRPLIDTPRTETQNVPDSRNFLKLFFAQKKPPDLFRSGGFAFMMSNLQTGIYIIGLPMCLSILHCGGFPSSAQYSSIEIILSFAVLMNDTT